MSMIRRSTDILLQNRLPRMTLKTTTTPLSTLHRRILTGRPAVGFVAVPRRRTTAQEENYSAKSCGRTRMPLREARFPTSYSAGHPLRDVLVLELCAPDVLNSVLPNCFFIIIISCALLSHYFCINQKSSRAAVACTVRTLSF